MKKRPTFTIIGALAGVLGAAIAEAGISRAISEWHSCSALIAACGDAADANILHEFQTRRTVLPFGQRDAQYWLPILIVSLWAASISLALAIALKHPLASFQVANSLRTDAMRWAFMCLTTGLFSGAFGQVLFPWISGWLPGDALVFGRMLSFMFLGCCLACGLSDQLRKLPLRAARKAGAYGGILAGTAFVLASTSGSTGYGRVLAAAVLGAVIGSAITEPELDSTQPKRSSVQPRSRPVGVEGHRADPPAPFVLADGPDLPC